MLIINSPTQFVTVIGLYQLCVNQTNPYFMWNVFQKGTNVNFNFTSDDVSTSPQYWNQFQITIATASVGLTSGIIPLTSGEWIYNIYEMRNEYDINISNSIILLKNGIMRVGLTYSNILPQNYINNTLSYVNIN